MSANRNPLYGGKPWIWAILAVVGIIILASAINRFRIASAQASEVQLPPPEINIIGLGYEAAPAAVTQTVSGITMDASNFRVENGYFKADVCYDLPSAADWNLPYTSRLQVGDKAIAIYEWGLIDWQTANDGTKRRCDDVNFPVTEIGEISEFQIIIPRLETTQPETLDCGAAQNKLDAANSGISIECVQTDTLSGPVLLDKPSSMSDEQAYQLINDAFIETLPGPWILEGKLQ